MKKDNSVPISKLEVLIASYTNKSGTLKANSYYLFVLDLKKLIDEEKQS